jgi:hypothetical protein
MSKMTAFVESPMSDPVAQGGLKTNECLRWKCGRITMKEALASCESNSPRSSDVGDTMEELFESDPSHQHIS